MGLLDYKPVLTFISKEEMLNRLDMDPHELDKECFANFPEYANQEFEIIKGAWDDLPEGWASPFFKFENGDVVAFDRTGIIRKINN